MINHETCNDCHWLEDNNTWCDMKRSGRTPNDKRCSDYDPTPRKFDPQIFHRMCKEYVEMYDKFKNPYFNDINHPEIKERFDINDAELISYILNDIQREIKYYKKYTLYEDLNKIHLNITQR